MTPKLPNFEQLNQALDAFEETFIPINEGQIVCIEDDYFIYKNGKWEPHEYEIDL